MLENWQNFMKKIKVFQVIQGPLVVVVTGIILGVAFQGSNLEISSDHMVSIPVDPSISVVTNFFNQFTFQFM